MSQPLENMELNIGKVVTSLFTIIVTSTAARCFANILLDHRTLCARVIELSVSRYLQPPTNAKQYSRLSCARTVPFIMEQALWRSSGHHGSSEIPDSCSASSPARLPTVVTMIRSYSQPTSLDVIAVTFWLSQSR
nr:hypothetical protein CFP56_11135 [Quercus suber]